MDLFIAVLDTERITNQTPYKGDLLHQLSTDLGGMPVYLSNSTGLRYVVPLSAIPKMVAGHMVSDVVACIGTIDIVLGECDR